MLVHSFCLASSGNTNESKHALWFLARLKTVRSVYLDTGTICIILAADQNILKLRLYNENGLKCTH